MFKYFNSSVFVILIMWLGPLQSQSYIIHGQIFDSLTMEPLIGVNILYQNQGVISDASGSFKIIADNPLVSLTLSHIGFISKKLEIEFSNKAEIHQDILMAAATTILNTATITASRFAEIQSRSVSTVEVLKPDLIRSIHATQLDDALRKIPGVQMVDGQLNVRGGNGWSAGAGSRVMVLVDDMPMLQPDAGNPFWNDVPIENIGQIELVKGASSALYGSSALSGTLNIRTGFPATKPETTVSVFHKRYLSPSDQTKKWWDNAPYNVGFSVLHKQKFGKLDAVGGLFYYNQDEGHNYRKDVLSEKKRLNLKLRYRLTDRLSISLNTNFNDGASANSFIWLNGTSGAYLPFPGALSESENIRFFVDPGIKYYDGNDHSHILRSRYYYVENNNNMNQSNSSKERFLEYVFTPSLKNIALQFTSGISGSWIVSDADLFSNQSLTGSSYAMYFQLSKPVNEKLNVSLGSRYEYNRINTPASFMGVNIPDSRISNDQIIMRSGLNYALDSKTFLRSSWGQGYRFPTIAERFISTSLGGIHIFPNVHLIPEKSWNGEIGIKREFNNSWITGYFDLVAFWSEYTDMLEFIFHQQGGISGLQSQNIGDTRIRGIEFSMNYEFTFLNHPLKFWGGYTYLDPKYKDFTDIIDLSSSADINFLKYRTRHHFNFDLEYQFHQLAIGFAMNGTSHILAIDQILEPIATIGQYRSIHNQGFRKMDVRLAYIIVPFRLSLIAENVLNEEYSERPGILAAPRTLGMRMDARF